MRQHARCTIDGSEHSPLVANEIERVDPLRLIHAVFPGGLMFAKDRFCSTHERRNDLLLLFPLGKRIEPSTRLFENFACGCSSISKPDMLQRAQPDIAALAAMSHADNPMAASTAFQDQNQPIAVRVASKFLEASDLQRAETPHNSGSDHPPRLPRTFPRKGWSTLRT